MSDQPILAYDCTTPRASIALRIGDSVHSVRLEPNRHAAELVEAIDLLLRAQSVAYTTLSCIVTTVGPGSFTGVRIGLAALHGLALASAVPVKTLTSLEAMAWDVARANLPSPFFTGLKAGKGEVYVQQFALTEGKPSPLGDIFLCSEADSEIHAPYYGNTHSIGHDQYIDSPNAEILCHIAPTLPVTDLSMATPIYIRPPDAAIPRQHAWLA